MITEAAVTRLARMAGVTRMDRYVYVEVQSYFERRCKKLVETIKTLVEYRKGSKSARVSEDEVVYALNFHKMKTYSANNKSLKRCKLYDRSGGPNKAVKEVRYYQNQHGCVHIPSSSLRQYLHELAPYLQWAKPALNTLHVTLEDWIIGVLDKAARVMESCKGRKTLLGSHVKTVMELNAD